MDKVKSAQPVILTTGEVLFVSSMIRALNADENLFAAMAKAGHMTDKQLREDLDFLQEKLNVMSFPQ